MGIKEFCFIGFECDLNRLKEAFVDDVFFLDEREGLVDESICLSFSHLTCNSRDRINWPIMTSNPFYSCNK